jgi:hypothetical protein
MESTLAPIPEPTLPADVWADSAAELTKHLNIRGHIRQSDLERLEAEYLAAGGQVQQIAFGVSAQPIEPGAPRSVAVNPDSPHSAAQQLEHESKRRARMYAGDSDLVATIAVTLPAVTKKQDLVAACQCSDDKVQRILRTYFADDPIAKPFMRNAGRCAA